MCLCAYTQTHTPFQNVFLTMCQIKSISSSPIFQGFVGVRQGVYPSPLTPALELICHLPTHTPVRLTCRLRKSLVNTRQGLLVVAFFFFLEKMENICACVHVHACHSTCVEVRGQLCGICSHHPPCGFWDLNPAWISDMAVIFILLSSFASPLVLITLKINT